MSKAKKPAKRFLLALLKAFAPQVLSRRAVIFGYTLMLEGSFKTPFVDQCLMELEMDGWIEQIPSEHQQAWRWSGVAGEPYGELSEAEAKRLLKAVGRIKLESDI